jgi:hypothetical protein
MQDGVDSHLNIMITASYEALIMGCMKIFKSLNDTAQRCKTVN